jgi:hypothetical protein
VRGAAIRFVPARPGRVVEVRGVAEARRQRGVVSVVVKAEPGTELRPLASSWDRVGCVVATGTDAHAAALAAERACSSLHVVTR